MYLRTKLCIKRVQEEMSLTCTKIWCQEPDCESTEKEHRVQLVSGGHEGGQVWGGSVIENCLNFQVKNAGINAFVKNFSSPESGTGGIIDPLEGWWCKIYSWRGWRGLTDLQGGWRYKTHWLKIYQGFNSLTPINFHPARNLCKFPEHVSRLLLCVV